MTDSLTTVPDSSVHLWVVGATTSERERLITPFAATPPLASVDAHRRLRGPYSAAGAIIRSVVPDALSRWPELAALHDIEILTVAPELGDALPCLRHTLTSLATPDERIRFYPRARTTRVAHGLTELLSELAGRSHPSGSTVIVENVEEADATDLELLAISLRRLDPRLLRLVLCSRGELPANLAEAVDRYAMRVQGREADSERKRDSVGLQCAGPSRHHRAALHVASECTSDDPLERGAYEALGDAERASLHDARAAELEARDELSLRLGAIPFHREHGSDPGGTGVEALHLAIEHCVMIGCYEAVIELGRRSHTLLDWNASPEQCWLVTAKMATALTALDRPDEAAELYDEACALSTLPSVHLQAAYGRAMLLTRFYDPERLDHLRAKGWINTAIAISSLLPEAQRRAFNVTFNENGLALIEMHLGDAQEALRLVTQGLERLDRELAPDAQTLHRSVLRYNRAQLLAKLRRAEEAVREYTKAIDADPHHSEYYFERAGLHRQLGQLEPALRDYEAAIRLSPPYPEAHYNRGVLALECGDVETALADLTYVLELEPAFADAYVNRASALRELGEHEAAGRDVDAGLALQPDEPRLHCLSGLIAQAAGRVAEARASFDMALRHDPSLVAAWSNRAVLSFGEGDVEAAIADLGRALKLDDDPVIRANLALANQHAGRYHDALADYTAALEGEHPKPAELRRQRAVCEAALVAGLAPAL